MRLRKYLQGTQDSQVILAFLRERLEALLHDERYEEAAEVALKVKKIEKTTSEVYETVFTE